MTEAESSQQEMLEIIQQQLMTVYDPEMPVIDIYTLGLIYNISIDEPNKTINILMTFTTPQCPMGEIIEQMIKNALMEVYPTWNVALEITFEPLWSPKMMKDEDLQKMFG